MYKQTYRGKPPCEHISSKVGREFLTHGFVSQCQCILKISYSVMSLKVIIFRHTELQGQPRLQGTTKHHLDQPFMGKGVKMRLSSTLSKCILIKKSWKHSSSLQIWSLLGEEREKLNHNCKNSLTNSGFMSPNIVLSATPAVNAIAMKSKTRLLHLMLPSIICQLLLLRTN